MSSFRSAPETAHQSNSVSSGDPQDVPPTPAGAYPPRIGVDLDNTIVCYDKLFHRLAIDRHLISPSVLCSKRAVRDQLRQTGQEDVWTGLQGEAYGGQMHQATPFDGVAVFFADCIRSGFDVFIISHRTREPFRGLKYDLHQAAYQWLEAHRLVGDCEGAIPRERVYLETTKTAKIQRIAELGCTHFIDDLPEFLTAAEFPTGTRRILFDPAGSAADDASYTRVRSWKAMMNVIRRDTDFWAVGTTA